MTTPSLPTPSKPCRVCAKPTTNKGGRCDTHTQQKNQQHREQRAYYHSKEWAALRAWVVQRDYHQCTLCSARTSLHVHHITPRKQGGEDTPSNLVTLCGKCHRDVEHGKHHALRELDQYIIIANLDPRP